MPFHCWSWIPGDFAFLFFGPVFTIGGALLVVRAGRIAARQAAPRESSISASGFGSIFFGLISFWIL